MLLRVGEDGCVAPGTLDAAENLKIFLGGNSSLRVIHVAVGTHTHACFVVLSGAHDLSDLYI
jgi:hypothetical protein